MNFFQKKYKNREDLAAFFYRYLCKVYEKISTIYENLFLLKSKPDDLILKKGIFKIKNNKNYNIDEVDTIKTFKINKYLAIRTLSDEKLKSLIEEIFNSKIKKSITEKTGFNFSIDFFIFYDRKYIPSEEKKVSTLKQAYSYRWHFDKPNSSNMLKIFLPLNISVNHGPLEAIDYSISKKFKTTRNIKISEKRTYFVGEKDVIYGLNPTKCLHRDGIPNKENTATQIMFQLNPHKEWAINKNLFRRKTSLNDKLGIWTTEPKFPLLAYFFDKRILF